jgi:predicted site-specific integrase-resolvase
MEHIQQKYGSLADKMDETDSVPIAKAAHELGLDVYTLYTFVQRQRVQAGLSLSGEFIIPKSEVERLARKE